MAYGRGEGSGIVAGLLAAIFIAFGVGLAGVMIAGGLVEARIADRQVTVNGVAEREVKADLAIWPLTVTAAGDDLAVAQAELDQDVARLESFFTGMGFDEAEVSLGILRLEDRLADDPGAQTLPGGRYRLAQPVRVRTTNVDLVAQSARELGDVIRQGVMLTGAGEPAFVYSRLDEIGPDMLEEAAVAARDAAQRFADDAGAQLGGVRNAEQSGFAIRPRDDVPGATEAAQIFKRVRVVATVTYQLEK